MGPVPHLYLNVPMAYYIPCIAKHIIAQIISRPLLTIDKVKLHAEIQFYGVPKTLGIY